MRPDPKTLADAIRRVDHHYRRGTMSDAGGVPTVLAAARWALDVLEGLDYEAATDYFPNENQSGVIVGMHCPLWYLTDWRGCDPPTTDFDDPVEIRREAWELIEALARELDKVPGITQGGEK